MFQNMDRAGEKMKSKYINKIRMDIGICIENKQQAEALGRIREYCSEYREWTVRLLFSWYLSCVFMCGRHQKDIFREKKTDVKTHNCCYQRREQNKQNRCDNKRIQCKNRSLAE